MLVLKLWFSCINEGVFYGVSQVGGAKVVSKVLREGKAKRLYRLIGIPYVGHWRDIVSNQVHGRRCRYLGNDLSEVRTRIPKRAMKFINQLVARGYYSSVADFARQSILDKLVNDFELGISELEPDLVEAEEENARSKSRR